jgi:hypothetical protein
MVVRRDLAGKATYKEMTPPPGTPRRRRSRPRSISQRRPIPRRCSECSRIPGGQADGATYVTSCAFFSALRAAAPFGIGEALIPASKRAARRLCPHTGE